MRKRSIVKFSGEHTHRPPRKALLYAVFYALLAICEKFTENPGLVKLHFIMYTVFHEN